MDGMAYPFDLRRVGEDFEISLDCGPQKINPSHDTLDPGVFRCYGREPSGFAHRSLNLDDNCSCDARPKCGLSQVLRTEIAAQEFQILRHPRWPRGLVAP